MSHFVGELERTLNRYNRENSGEIALRDLPFQKLQPPTRNLLEGFSRLTIIRIEGCDLRTLENFPVLARLTHLIVSSNKLQGSFQHILPLTQLKYLDASNNLLMATTACYPLRAFKGLTIHVAGNPFTNREEDWKETLRSYKLTIDEKPRAQQAQPASDSWSRIRQDIDLEQRRLKVFKQPNVEDRDRERNYQRTLQNLISMVQMTNSAIEAELTLPKRENLRWANCSVEDVDDLEEPSLRSGTSFAEAGCSHLSNFHMMPSPRYRESRMVVDPADFRGDLGLMDDRFEMASDQY